MSQEQYLKDLLKRIIDECEECGVSNIYENLGGSRYIPDIRDDFPSELGKLLGEARLAIGELD